MSTVERIERPFISFEGGQYDWRRLAGGSSFALGGGELTVVGQWKGYDGPWDLPEDLEHFSAYSKFAKPTGLGDLQLSLSFYDATWKPTEQIPERAIGTPICRDQFCALDPSATGETLRFIGSARLIGAGWRATLYAQSYDWNMYSDPTYDFQIRQWDRRQTYGGRFAKELLRKDTFEVTAGIEGRYDDIGKVQVDHTQAREFLELVSAHTAREGSTAAYTEANWRPSEPLRLFAGLRADYYSFRATATDAAFLSGSASDEIFSPKAGIAYRIGSSLELYGNWGRGFHSNDSRGVAASDPPVPGLVPGEGTEIGVRYELGNATIAATYWWLDVDSELKFVGDSNSVEPGTASKRHGYELVGFWRPRPWLAFDAVWTQTDAHSEDSPDAEHIPGAVESAGELGVAAIRGPWEASMRVRHLGPYPLVEDDSLRAGSETTVNVRAAWKRAGLTWYGEVLNVLDSDGKDIVYFYESFLPAIDSAPTEGRVSRATEPRTLRVGVKWELGR
jgi:outer membrane receptor protein involved in Fe transport